MGSIPAVSTVFWWDRKHLLVFTMTFPSARSNCERGQMMILVVFDNGNLANLFQQAKRLLSVARQQLGQFLIHQTQIFATLNIGLEADHLSL